MELYIFHTDISMHLYFSCREDIGEDEAAILGPDGQPVSNAEASTSEETVGDKDNTLTTIPSGTEEDKKEVRRHFYCDNLSEIWAWICTYTPWFSMVYVTVIIHRCPKLCSLCIGYYFYCSLTHCGLGMPYGGMNLGQLWLR